MRRWLPLRDIVHDMSSTQKTQHETPSDEPLPIPTAPSAMTILRVIGIMLGAGLVVAALWVALGGYETLMLDPFSMFLAIGFGIVFGSILVYINSHKLMDQRIGSRS